MSTPVGADRWPISNGTTAWLSARRFCPTTRPHTEGGGLALGRVEPAAFRSSCSQVTIEVPNAHEDVIHVAVSCLAAVSTAGVMRLTCETLFRWISRRAVTGGRITSRTRSCSHRKLSLTKLQCGFAPAQPRVTPTELTVDAVRGSRRAQLDWINVDGATEYPGRWRLLGACR